MQLFKLLLRRKFRKRKFKKKRLNKNDLGREKFIEKVWEWKNQYGDIIINQLKKLRLFM